MSLERYAFTSDGQRIILPEKDFQQLFGDHTAWKSRPPLRTEYQFHPVSRPIPEDCSAELIPNITYVDKNTQEIMHCEVYPLIGPPTYPRGAISNPSPALQPPRHQGRHGTPSGPFSPVYASSPSSSARCGSLIPDTARSSISSSSYLSSPSPGLSNEDHRSTHIYSTGDYPSPASSPAYPRSPRDSIASGSRSPARRHTTHSTGEFPALSFAPVSPRTSSRASNTSSRSRHATPTFGMSSPAPSPRTLNK